MFCPAPVQSFQSHELDRLFSGKSINTPSCHRLHRFWRQSILPKAHSHLWRGCQKKMSRFSTLYLKRNSLFYIETTLDITLDIFFPFQIYIYSSVLISTLMRNSKQLRKDHKELKNMSLLMLQKNSLKTFCVFCFWIILLKIAPASSPFFMQLSLSSSHLSSLMADSRWATSIGCYCFLDCTEN